jgi:hypothetical protein
MCGGRARSSALGGALALIVADVIRRSISAGPPRAMAASRGEGPDPIGRLLSADRAGEGRGTRAGSRAKTRGAAVGDGQDGGPPAGLVLFSGVSSCENATLFD